MKTRIVKVTEGYVGQIQLLEEYKGFWFWKKPIYKWVGVNDYGLTYGSPRSQLRECVMKTEEEAKACIDTYFFYENKENKEEEDSIVLSSD
jgi:hypothetical protein